MALRRFRGLVPVIALMLLASALASAQQSAPVEGAGPLERRAVAVTPENPIPKRIATMAAVYPTDISDRTIRGTVTLRVTVDALGHVAEARQAYRPDPSMIPVGDGSFRPAPPLSAPFVKAALDAVRMWQYEPPAQAPISFYVRLNFIPDQPAIVIWHEARAPVTVGTGTDAARVPGGVPGGVVGVNTSFTPPPPPPPSGAPIRVGGNISPPKKIKDVSPVYPPLAQSARVQGIVIIEATIGPQGTVTDARVLRSISLLDQAALDAVRQWEFTPTLINGVPVAIIMSVTVNFQLRNDAPAGATTQPAPPQ